MRACVYCKSRTTNNSARERQPPPRPRHCNQTSLLRQNGTGSAVGILDAAIARFPGQLSITSRCQGENMQSRKVSYSTQHSEPQKHPNFPPGFPCRPVFAFSARQWKCGVLCRKAKGSPKCCDVLAKQHKTANQSAQTSSLCKQNQDEIFKQPNHILRNLQRRVT